MFRFNSIPACTESKLYQLAFKYVVVCQTLSGYFSQLRLYQFNDGLAVVPTGQKYFKIYS